MKTTLVITRLTFHEAARRKILWAAFLFAIMFLIAFGTGFHFIQSEMQRELTRSSSGAELLQMNEIYNFLLMAGLYVTNFLTVMMSVLTSVDTLSGEINSGTIQSIVTKPLHRREIVLGKWLGFVIILSLYVLLLVGGVMGVVYVLSNYMPQNPFNGFALIWLNGMLMLSVSLLGGAALSTLANGVLVFGLFGVAFIGGWIEYVGSFIQNQAAVNLGIVSSLILPSEALWKRAAYEMRSPLASAFGFSPFTSIASVPSPLMVWYAVGYILIMIVWAIGLFNRRDL